MNMVSSHVRTAPGPRKSLSTRMTPSEFRELQEQRDRLEMDLVGLMGRENQIESMDYAQLERQSFGFPVGGLLVGGGLAFLGGGILSGAEAAVISLPFGALLGGVLGFAAEGLVKHYPSILATGIARKEAELGLTERRLENAQIEEVPSVEIGPEPAPHDSRTPLQDCAGCGAPVQGSCGYCGR